jgi:aconitate hydratase
MLRRVNGTVEYIEAQAAVETQLEVELLRAGGVIPSILQQTIRTHRGETAKA